ncbi:hypothetical protein [Gillisia sp. Hel_I_86]|uniref:hypothetical protein n=1 Tax=Gillisia sp. Hel_I_86 TaxID=1249981 RepID=UPI00119F52DF|nr:hypothetical protein [Gillisia sp. Hel_I_86]
MNEELIVNLSLNELRENKLEKDEKKFFLKWLTENEFIISLNFSIGTNYALDINEKAKSAIIAYGVASELNKNKTHIKLKTKFKNGLVIILLLPIVMLILQLTLNLEIPILFFLFPIIFYVIIIMIFNSEEKKLLRYFKEYFT